MFILLRYKGPCVVFETNMPLNLKSFDLKVIQYIYFLVSFFQIININERHMEILLFTIASLWLAIICYFKFYFRGTWVA